MALENQTMDNVLEEAEAVVQDIKDVCSHFSPKLIDSVQIGSRKRWNYETNPASLQIRIWIIVWLRILYRYHLSRCFHFLTTTNL
jgi:hypothetical protein